MTTEEKEERIPTSTIVVYSSPMLGVFFAGALISFYLLKYSTDILLIGPAVIGSILAAARIWDAITDPAVGWLSDRTNARMGRRRPWIFWSAIPFGLSVIMLWSPPASLDGIALTLWIGAAILLFYTLYTTYRVPHMALGAELSRGYHDRTRVFAMSQAFESIGMMSAAAVLIFLERSDNPREFARILSVFIAIFAALLMMNAAWRLNERQEFQGKGAKSPWKSFGDVLGNPHARLLVAVFFLEQLGFATLVALMPYLSDYVVNTPGDTGIYLFCAIGAALISIPFWVWVSRIFGKKDVWIWSMVGKCILFGSLFFLQPGNFSMMMIISLGFGLMNGCASVIGPSLKADVIDWDHAETGERKEGSYFAAWNFVQKAAGGVAIWVIGMTLAMTGFEPNVQQSEETVLGMRFLASAGPFAFHVLGLILMLRFTLNQQEHQAAVARAAAG